MLTSSGGRSMLTVADRGGKICQNLADVICERSHIAITAFCISVLPEKYLG